MLEMMKNTWKKMQDNWLKLSLGSLGVLGVATFNVVFPPSLLPTLVILATAVVGTALSYVVSFVASYFATKADKTAAKEEAAVTPKEEAKKDDAAATSTAKMQTTLEANKTAEVAVTSDADKATVVTKAAENAANADFVVEETKDADATMTVSMR